MYLVSKVLIGCVTIELEAKSLMCTCETWRIHCIYAWHDSFIRTCETWLAEINNTSPIHMFIWDTMHSHEHMRDVTHAYVHTRHDSLMSCLVCTYTYDVGHDPRMNGSWLIHMYMWDMAYLYEHMHGRTQDSDVCTCVCTCETWLTDITWYKTHSYVHMRHDAFNAHTHAWHDSIICTCETWLISQTCCAWIYLVSKLLNGRSMFSPGTNRSICIRHVTPYESYKTSDLSHHMDPIHHMNHICISHVTSYESVMPQHINTFTFFTDTIRSISIMSHHILISHVTPYMNESCHTIWEWVMSQHMNQSIFFPVTNWLIWAVSHHIKMSWHSIWASRSFLCALVARSESCHTIYERVMSHNMWPCRGIYQINK